MERKYQIVIDTNVLVSALRSRNGASFLLLNLVRNHDERFEINISTPLVLEYESVLKRDVHLHGNSLSSVEYFIDDLISLSNKYQVHYLLRPYLNDPDDDFIAELAFCSCADYIVTYNENNFKNAIMIGVEVIKPKDFLVLIAILFTLK